MEYVRSTIAGRVGAADGRSAEADVEVVQFDRAQRRYRAALGLGSWCGAALMTAFVPGIRIAAVGLLGLGVYSAARRWRTEQVVVRVDGTCPACEADEALEARDHLEASTPIVCRRCGARLTFSPEPCPTVTAD